MLARNQISDVIMINVDYLNFGKLVSGADGFGSAPQGLGVTSRSAGLTPEHDGELRLNSLLDVQVFSPSMIDPKMADKGLLLVRSLPGTPAAPRGRTVFVRARFRQDGSDGADSRPHQQASIWVVSTDTWSRHPAPILAKVGKELEAEPDRADNSQRFDVPPKVVSLDAQYPSGEDASNEKWRYAYYSILDLLLPKVGVTGSRDREVTFGSDVFETEADFLALVGSTLQDLPVDFEWWKDIRIGSGLRSTGGLIIRYLPSERSADIASIAERIVTIKSRRDRLWGGRSAIKASLPKISSARPADAVTASAAKNPVGEMIAGAARSLQAANSVAQANERPQGRMSLAGFVERFQRHLTEYRAVPTQSSAQKLVQTAQDAKAAGALEKLELMDHHSTLDAICSVLEPPPQQALPLGGLFDRVLLLGRLPPLNYHDQWLSELLSAVAKLGVLLPQEFDRWLEIPNTSCAEFRGREDLRQAYKNSQELKNWLSRVESGSGKMAVPDLAFLKKLRMRLKDLADGLDFADEKGIHNKVIVRSNFLMDRKELLATHRQLLQCLAVNLYNMLEEQKLLEESKFRGDASPDHPAK